MTEMEFALAAVMTQVVLVILYYAAMITLYVLGSLGLYTIASRREIRHPWMAWVPLLNIWTLGSISDQYQYVVKGRIRNRRKWMIGLAIAVAVLMVAMFVALFAGYFQFFSKIMYDPEMVEYMTDVEAMEMVFAAMGPFFGIALVCIGVSIALAVLEYMCYYHLFASCDPEYKVLYLVLGILFGFLMPIFVFVCRKKDRGMPPRRDAIPPVFPQFEQTPRQPVEPWALPQQNADPWTQPDNKE